MYKILGGDGKEYGPVSVETLQQWIREGRANAETQVLPEGGTAWVALGNVPEFVGLTAGPAPGVGMADAGTAGEPDQDRALALATPAGWALMIVGLLGILMCIGLTIFYAINGSPQNPLLERLMSQQGGSDAMKIGQKVGVFLGSVIGIFWAGFMAYAGLKLRRLQSWGLVLTGAILAIIPCCGSQFPMCVLSAPVGVWVIVVICQAKVKKAFH